MEAYFEELHKLWSSGHAPSREAERADEQVRDGARLKCPPEMSEGQRKVRKYVTNCRC